MQTGAYSLPTVFTIAKDIAENNKDIYRMNNNLNGLKNVPFNYYLENVEMLAKYCERVAKAMNPDLEVMFYNSNLIGENASFHIYDGKTYNAFITRNAALRRFGMVRECCSLYTNHYGLSKTPFFENKDDLTDYLSRSVEGVPVSNDIDDLDFDNHTFTTLLAVELMIPPFHRKYTVNLLNDYYFDLINISDVARSLDIPKRVFQEVINLQYFNDANDFYRSNSI